jgi:hypothetical protein
VTPFVLPENHLRVADDVLGVGVTGHFELESADIIVGAQCPEVRLLDVKNAVKLTHLKKTKTKTKLEQLLKGICL